MDFKKRFEVRLRSLLHLFSFSHQDKNCNSERSRISFCKRILRNPKCATCTLRFVNEVFKPDLRALCTKIGLPNDECEFKHKWNQASFAAFLTYEEEQDFLSSVQTRTKMNLKEILKWLRGEYKTFKDQDKIESFTDYLKTKVTDATAVTH